MKLKFVLCMCFLYFLYLHIAAFKKTVLVSLNISQRVTNVRHKSPSNCPMGGRFPSHSDSPTVISDEKHCRFKEPFSNFSTHTNYLFLFVHSVLKMNEEILGSCEIETKQYPAWSVTVSAKRIAISHNLISN